MAHHHRHGMRVRAMLFLLAAVAVPSSLADYSSLWDALQGEKLVTLSTIINIAGQKDQFNDPTFAVTMFAPRNGALASVVAKLAVSNLKDLNAVKTQAQTILTYHIIPLTNINFTDNLVMPTVLAFSAQPNMTALLTFRVLDANNRYVGGKLPGSTFSIVSKITANKTDLYIIDDVLYPPSDMFNTPLTVPAFIANDDRLTILNTLLSNDTTLLAIANNPNLAVTVFAPTDDAFNAYFQASGQSVDSLLGTPLLDRLLRNHIIPAQPIFVQSLPEGTGVVFASASDVPADNLTLTKTTKRRLLIFTTTEYTVQGAGNTDPVYIIDNDNAAAVSAVQVTDGVILPDLSVTTTATTGSRRRLMQSRGGRMLRKARRALAETAV